jgi:hypothetical protein
VPSLAPAAPAAAPAVVPPAVASPAGPAAPPAQLAVPLPQVEQAGTHSRVGPDRCKGCHRVQHESWTQSAHAKKGLDCESCHGNGGDYLKVMKDPAKAAAAGLVMPGLSFCKRCHAVAAAPLLVKVHAHKVK